MQQVIKIQPVTELSKEYTRTVVEDSILYGKRDMEKAMLIEARNMALILMRRLENLLFVSKKEKEKENLSPEQISYVEESLNLKFSSAEEALNDLKTVVASEDANLIQSKIREARICGKDIAW